MVSIGPSVSSSDSFFSSSAAANDNAGIGEPLMAAANVKSKAAFIQKRFAIKRVP
jgi:hypothetical protein